MKDYPTLEELLWTSQMDEFYEDLMDKCLEVDMNTGSLTSKYRRPNDEELCPIHKSKNDKIGNERYCLKCLDEELKELNKTKEEPK